MVATFLSLLMILRFFRPLLLSFLLIAPASAQVDPKPVPPVPPGPVPPAPKPDDPPTPKPGDPKPGDPPVPAEPGSDTPGSKDGDNKVGPTPIPTPVAKPIEKPEAKPKTIEELVKGYDKVDGIFTLYRKVANNKQSLLAEIRESQIGPLFLLQSTYETGAAGLVAAGRPSQDVVWKWTKTPDNRLVVTVPNLWYRSTDPNLKIAVARDFPDAYLDVYPIMAESKENGTVLIDFTSFFDGSITGLDTAFAAPPGAGPPRTSYALDPKLNFVKSLKNFPLNMVVEANYHYKRVGQGTGQNNDALADARSLPLQVVFNLYGLPEKNGYQPRLADPRVGFFVNGQLSAGRAGFQTFDDEAKADARVIYINRWHLQKADPSARVSAPVQPIVFVLDETIPSRYHQVMRSALLSWNKPFERLGFINAVVVKDAKDVAGYDHADMRFNTLRWNASSPSSGSAYAVALLRENPMTGQIINASITVDANWARVGFRQKIDTVNPVLGTNEITALRMGGEACEITAQFSDPRFDDEKYVNQLLFATVAHEFGHILGLRHNFMGSLFHSPATLADPKLVAARGISSSVMDYVGFNVFGLKTGANLFATGPGTYDYWAIRYGYTPIAAPSPAGEKAELNKIAGLSYLPGHAYSSDDQADDYDPTIVRYDLSSEPLTYIETSFGVSRKLLATLDKNEPKPSEGYERFTSRLRSLIRSKGRDANLAVRFVGGARVRRVVQGDKNPNQPFTPVPLSQQRRALQLINTEIFAPNAFQIPTRYLTKTAIDPFDRQDSFADEAFPIRDDIANLRSGILNSLLAPARLDRMSNTQWKFPSQTLSMSELYLSLRKAIWGPLAPATVYTTLQRDLARQHLQILVDTVIEKRPGTPDDAILLAGADLRALKAQLSAPRKSSPDAMTRLFFADALRRIDLALTKKMD